MSGRYVVKLTPEEAEQVLQIAKQVVELNKRRGLHISQEKLARRLAEAVTAGERDPHRLIAIALGPEAAPRYKPN